MARKTKDSAPLGGSGATAPAWDVVVRPARRGRPIAFVRAGSPKGEEWLRAATDVGEHPPVSAELGWWVERDDVGPLLKLAVGAGMRVGVAEARTTAGGVQ